MTAVPPVCEGFRLGSLTLRATVQPVDESCSDDELYKVPDCDRAHLGRSMQRSSTPTSASGSRGCASVLCPPQVTLMQGALHGC